MAATDVYGFYEIMSELDTSKRIVYTGVNAEYTPLTFERTSGSVNYGKAIYNDWVNFPLFATNKPFMVKSDGSADYQLDEDDYTKKAEDGSASDVNNVNYNGGAFAWIQKIYRKQWIEDDKRYVNFCMTKLDDSYHADGFIGPNNEELDGIWVPMFYGTVVEESSVSKLKSIAGDTELNNGTNMNTSIAYLSNISPTKGRIFGGPIISVIGDLLTMFAKSQDTVESYGYGYALGSGNVPHNNVVDGGRFYCTKTGSALNKILHSIVLGTYVLDVQDPYIAEVGGKIYVSNNYTFSQDPVNDYTYTGIDYATEMSGTEKLGNYLYFKNIDGFGCIVSDESEEKGSSQWNDASTDMFRSSTNSASTIVNGAGRLGRMGVSTYRDYGKSGYRYMRFEWTNTYAGVHSVITPMMLPADPPVIVKYLSEVKLPNDEVLYKLRDSIFAKLGLGIQNGQVVQTYLVDEEEGE